MTRIIDLVVSNCEQSLYHHPRLNTKKETGKKTYAFLLQGGLFKLWNIAVEMESEELDEEDTF